MVGLFLLLTTPFIVTLDIGHFLSNDSLRGYSGVSRCDVIARDSPTTTFALIHPTFIDHQAALLATIDISQTSDSR